MRRLLLIGNGFDLAHSLPTSYIDFLFLCQKYAEINSIFEFEKRKIHDEVLRMYKCKYNKKYVNKIKDNSWINYFIRLLNEEACIGRKWIDFESEIKNVCNAYIRSLKDLKAQKIAITRFEEFMNEYDDFDVARMKKDLISLIDILDSYLIVVNEIEIKFYSPDIISFVPTDVISFNYTNTYDRIYGIRERIDFIHGKTKDTNNQSSIVLGFESYKDKKLDYDFAEFIKYYQMVNNDVSINILDNNNKNDFISMFYGHSLDVTDSDVIEEVIEKSVRVFILYHNAGHKSSIIKNLIKIYGHRKFREFCLGKNKRIYFVSQAELIEKDYQFTNSDMMAYSNIVSYRANANIFKSFMCNYRNYFNYGIFGNIQLFYATLRLFEKNEIDEKTFEFEINNILKHIEENYDNNYPVFMFNKEKLITELTDKIKNAKYWKNKERQSF